MNRAAPHSFEETYDQWLVIRAQSGDEESLRLLVERWSPVLRRHAARLVGDPHGAADVAQDAWLAIVRGLTRLDDPACFRRWAYRIVGNKSADWVRTRQRARSTNASLNEEPAAPPPRAGPEAVDRLRAALDIISQPDRVLLAMRYLDGMPVAEIADVLETPIGTAKSRLHHARARLRAVLKAMN